MKECPLGQFRAGARGSTLLDHTRRIHGTRRRDKASSIPDTCYSPPTISCAFAGVYDLREIPRRFDMREFVAVLPQSCGKLTTSNTAVPFGGVITQRRAGRGFAWPRHARVLKSGDS